MDTTCSASGERVTIKRFLPVNGNGTGHGAKIPASYMTMMLKQCLDVPSFKVTFQ